MSTQLRLIVVLVGGAFAFASGLVACGDDDAGGEPAGGAGRVAYIHLKPTNSDSWESGGFDAVSAMAMKYHLTVDEQVVSHDEAAAVLRRLGPRYDLIVAHSSGYGDAMLEVAPEFPDTKFIVFSDLANTKGVENVSAWAINWNEMGYLGGAVACLAAKSRGSDDIGQVNSQPIPAFARFGGGAEQAADELGCTYRDRWTNSFTDTAKAKQAALSMVADGTEVLLSTADAGDQGTREAAESQDKLFVTNYSEADIDRAPESTITALTVNFDVAYDELGRAYSDGTLESKKYPVDVEGGGLGVATPLRHVDGTVQARVTDVLDRMKSGETRVDANRTTNP